MPPQPEPADSQRRWYVVYTRPHREFGAAGELGNQNFRVFLPTHIKTVRHARQFRTVRAPFFPRYLFVSLDLSRDQWRKVNGTIGVSQLIMEGPLPKPVPPGVVEGLMDITNTEGNLDFEPRLETGQPVRLLSGAFAGLVGELINLDANGRVRVLLEIMGNVVKVETRRDRLAPMD